MFTHTNYAVNYWKRTKDKEWEFRAYTKAGTVHLVRVK